MKTMLRICLAVAIVVLLATPAGYAGSSGSAHRSRPAAGGPVDQAWSWLAQLWAKHGGCIDPDGLLCASAAQPPSSDHGGCIDPNGSPCAAKALPASDAGGCIDPNGAFCAGPR
jgi:hypothetical protein